MDQTLTLPKNGQSLHLDGRMVTVVSATATDTGVDLVIRETNGDLRDASVTWDTLAAGQMPENDGGGRPDRALAGLWGRWMQFTAPRLRQASLATRALEPFAHQDEAVFDHMLPQPRLRFLLADEPGTGKTIMTGMYLVEAKRRLKILGKTIIVVPAHLVQKWQEELEDFFGVRASILTAEIARDPMDLHPLVDVWIVSLDLYTHNPDVRRKAAGAHGSWSLAVFDEAHRLTPTSRYLAAARDLADRSHHLLLLTATPHRGKEHFFRGLCNLLDPEIYPWSVDGDQYEDSLRPSKLSFLRRMKEELRDRDGARLFPERYAETVPVNLVDIESAAYDAVMEYASKWYGDNSTLALSIYGKRAASSLVAARATLRRRLESLSGSASKRGLAQIPDTVADGLSGIRPLSEAFEDPEDLVRAEDVVVTAATKDKSGEIEAVKGLLEQLDAAIELCSTPTKWLEAEKIMAKHEIKPGEGQLLVFTEFADTARWLAGCFKKAGYTTETLEGAVDHRERHAMQRRFLNGEFQVLVSTDAGGEGINLQSAHVMVDWDIPWSLVRLEQRMGRLHRIGQKHDVHIYHLVAPRTREGRVQQVMLENIEAAAKSLGRGRIFDLLDATVASADAGFDFARALTQAQSQPHAEVRVPDADALTRASEKLASEDKHLRSKVDQAAAEARFRADRLEKINPVIVAGFIDVVAAAKRWKLDNGPVGEIKRLKSAHDLPKSFGGKRTALIAADGAAVQRAQSDDAGLDDVIVFGPTEEAFRDLVNIALNDGRGDLLRGCRLTDTGSITNYRLFIFESELRMHDGMRQTPTPTPILIRWSGAGAFEVSWESLLTLKPVPDADPGSKPTPAQIKDAQDAARTALKKEIEVQKRERLGWVKKERQLLDDCEDRLNDETASLPKAQRKARTDSFKKFKNERLAQLSDAENVQATALRLVGWVDVEAGISLDELGYSPDAEKIATGRVIEELQNLGYAVDDRQTARVGYDLLAKNSKTGDQRCVEVKGITESMGPVWMEQNEWAQALQRREDYWLYVVDHCATKPVVRVRVQDPANVFGGGANKIERFQIKLSQLKDQVH